MSADVVVLYPPADPSKTMGELVDEADSVPVRRLRKKMLLAAKAAGELNVPEWPPGSPAHLAELRQLVTLGALLTRYLFKVCEVPGERDAII
jgi:hypothetical protein